MKKEIRDKIKAIIKNSPYRQQINCVLGVLEQLNINTWADLQNLPRIGHFCGVDVYQLLQVLNEGWDKDFTPKPKKEAAVVRDEQTT